MLCLLFSVGDRRFCIEATKVLRVLNRVAIKPLMEAPRFVTGIIQFEQQWLPVVDLCELATGRGCLNNMSTRMILIDYKLTENSHARIALVAESVDDTIDLNPSQFQDDGLNLKDHQFFGDRAVDNTNTIQMLKPENLLSQEALQILTPRLAEGCG